jgi:hypothetical protein
MEKFLHLLSPALRSSVLSFIHEDLIEQIPYFKMAEAAEISFLVSRMKTSLALPKDDVITQGIIGDSMFFLINGKAAVLLSKKKFTKPEEETAEVVESNFNKLMRRKTTKEMPDSPPRSPRSPRKKGESSKRMVTSENSETQRHLDENTPKNGKTVPTSQAEK